MNDLNAPLGNNKTRKAAPKNNGKGRKIGVSAVIIGLLMTALIAVNASVFLTKTPMDETQIVRLPMPEAPQVAVAEAPQEKTPAATGVPSDQQDVNIRYGTPNGTAPSDDNEPLPIPSSADNEIQVSPGGPRIIRVTDPTAVEIGQQPSRAHIPVDEALEETAFGKLPIRTSNGRRPSDIYARPWSAGGGKRIALVIGGLGLSQTGTQRAINDLPPEITLAFAPTGYSLDRWMREARKKGHEILIQVPMEPFDYPNVNPGPNTLRLSSSPQTNIENLQWALGKITNYTGIMNYLGARFMADKNAMQPIMEELARRGLLFFNDGSAGISGNLSTEALSVGLPYLSNNVNIDSANDAASIRVKLKALESLASARGSAVGYGNALELTVKTVADWANEAKKSGFEIVGVAALAKDPERR